MLRVQFASVVGLMIISFPILAHPGHDHLSIYSGLMTGLLHPLVGIDHLLVLVAVGYFSSQFSSMLRWVLPLLFVSLMLIGFGLAHAGVHLVATQTIEAMILVSMCLSIFLVLINQIAVKILSKMGRFEQLPAVGTCMLMLFAIFHGAAHGYEIPYLANTMGFGSGFILASVAVIFLAHVISKSRFVVLPLEH